MLGYLISLSLLVAGGHGLRRFVDPVVAASGFDHASIPAQPQYSWTEYWYSNMPIDHFAYGDNRTFSLRYLMNLDKYVPGGPIFFYTGNEGPIDGFANNTGLVWDLSTKFKAAVVFAEHRFYGMTQPFGDQSYTTLKNLGYLSSEQALADYAVLLGYLKKGIGAGTINSATSAPVIAFGGSYGGMLAAWFRIKYPHVVVGALSSSAPVLQFVSTGIDQGIFEKIVKRTYVNSGCNADNFPNAWTAITNLAANAEGRSFLNTLFKLSPFSQVTDVSGGHGLNSFIREGIEYMAMVDYPYPSNFLKPLPGWPVQVACSYLNGTINDDKALATAMYYVANLYYNYTGSETTFCAPYINSSCSDAAVSALSSPLGWPWQACTEMAMPICALGPPNDLFTPPECPSNSTADWTADVFFSLCDTFSELGFTQEQVRPDWIITNYGGNFAAASNIIFSNGDLDPWSGGGVTSSSPGVAQAATNGVYTMLIEQSGHHLDLRQPNSCDPPSVRQARFQQVAIMWCWAYPNDPQCVPGATTMAATPTTTPSTATTAAPGSCNYEQNAYPWGQTGGGSTTTGPTGNPPGGASFGLTPLIGLVLSAVIASILRF